MDPARFTQILLGVLATAFFAWAGVVWTGVSKLTVVSTTMERVTKELDEHNGRPWHEEAGHLIRLQAQHLEAFQADIQRLEAKVDALLRRPGNGMAP